MRLLFLIFISLLLSFNYALPISDCNLGYFFNGTSCEECGLTSVEPNVRIVGGIQALNGSWPAQVLIVQYELYEGQRYLYSYCGGTLINRQTVLTAAHCILDTDYETEYVVYIGAYNISWLFNNGKPEASATAISVSKTIKHPGFNLDILQNDIGIHILSSPVLLTKYKNVACLPQKSTTFPLVDNSNKVYVSGWGRLSEGGTTARVLYNVNLTVLSTTQCENVLPKYKKNWDSQICAGVIEGGKDTCQGDSGGGLTTVQNINDKQKYFVAGVVSYGDGCARKGKPGIYTRTSYHIDWIKKNMFVPTVTTIAKTTAKATTTTAKATTTTAKATKTTAKANTTTAKATKTTAKATTTTAKATTTSKSSSLFTTTNRRYKY